MRKLVLGLAVSLLVLAGCSYSPGSYTQPTDTQQPTNMYQPMNPRGNSLY